MLIAIQILCGFVLLIVGAEVLVRGAVRLAALLGMTPLVIGLTVVAFGTSSPELAVSLQSVFAGSAELAVGNAVGSNTLNILLILGLAALIFPMAVQRQVIRLDLPVMIGVTVALLLICRDGEINRWEGIGMVIFLISYISFLIRISRRETRQAREAAKAALAEIEQEASETSNENEPASISSFGLFVKQASLVIAGLLILGFGCRLFVNGSVELARVLGVSELMIGLTVVSIGTSLPELVTTVIASFRNQREMAVGNIVGSNLFNILCVLGVTASVSPVALPVPEQAILFDIPVTLGAAIICLPIFFTKMEISRWEGLLMVVLYSAYLGYLVMVAVDSPYLDLLTFSIWYGLFPFTLVLLTGSMFLSLKKADPHG
ncbi:MAG: calcium/sodium antiporter, partial [Planctomycetaceae bacterium]|nr:calcium/sodium antiporter [Planctomycetaceae bacterium]MCP4463299.1 calcium/sodium antiporter [Planctomycetaceae bacterium]MDG1809408.1 calcium/sodium antiporter [Pirellulaceae bacterium]MDG2104243.1 calcium/sodium antiporter [Pirellulaceae bacterium]